MKLTVNDGVARQLLDRLQDEQPGTDLQNLRRQLEIGLAGNRQLTGEELNLILMAVLDLEERLEKLGNPTASEKLKLRAIAGAMPKLEAMRDRQVQREANGE